jgi:tRNA(Ile)-lysidine synthase
MEIIQEVREYCARNGLLGRGDKILLAVSGGPDSAALLHILHLLAGETGFEIAVAHLEHGIRGKESLGDRMFVKEQSGKLGLPFFSRSVVMAEVQKRNESLEEAARRVRYSFLFKLLNRTGFSTIATGHTLDDNIETLLFRLVSGTGPAGAVGILPRNGKVIHPLLSVTREEIMDYLSSHDFEYRTDKTNYDRRYPRNRIRHEVVPVLKEVNIRYREHMQHFMDIVGGEYRFMDRAAAQALDRLAVEMTDDAVSLSYAGFKALDPALRRRVILEAKKRLFSGTDDAGGFYIPFRVLQYLSEYHGSGSRTLYRKGPFSVQSRYETLLFKKNIVKQKDYPYLYYVEEMGGLVLIDEIQRKAIFRIRGHIETFDNKKLYFDYRKLKFPIVIRSRKEGDRICLHNLGTKKVKSLLIDGKVPRDLRGTVPIIESSGEVIGIFLDRFGMANRCATGFMVTNRTDKILECGLVE